MRFSGQLIPPPGRRRRTRYGGVALLLAVPLVTTAVVLPAHAGTAAGSRPASGLAAAPAVNLALNGTATATTTESGDPASNAIDGDAGTDWCTSGWTGTVTVDLGQIRSLSDLGITLDDTSPSASATIELASRAGTGSSRPR
ncbi:MAG TPA: discoidin domain-containing protein [Trebonia sp.]|jgi:hypothetical protein|nr:discoidin domain-containing protein [Trebonia sp.]